MKQIIRRTLLLPFAIILVISGMTACKKKNSEPPKSFNYTAKLDGQWVFTGTGYHIQYKRISNDVFMPISSQRVNDTQIVFFGDTLTYQATDFAKQTHLFTGDFYTYKRTWTDSLWFNYATNTLLYDHYFSGATSSSYIDHGLYVQTGNTLLDPLLKEHVAKIAGEQKLSGIVYDTTWMGYYTQDCEYTVNEIMIFTKVDDRTIAYDKNYAGVYDDTLHYRTFDEAAGTLTFETYHSPLTRNFRTSVVFNYRTNSLIFEQTCVDFPSFRIIVKLHN